MDQIITTAPAIMAVALPSPRFAAATLAAVLAAAVLRGFTGFGFALAAVPLMGMAMMPSEAVPIAVLLQLIAGLNDLRRNHRDGHWWSLRWLIMGAVIGSPLGALVLSVAPAAAARLIISCITFGAVIVLGRGFAFAAVPSRLVTVGVGTLAGLFNGLAGMPAPAVVVYYMSGPFRSVVARASLLIFFLATSVAAFASIAFFGLATARVIWLTLLTLPVMFVGTWIGEQGFRRGTARLHRQVSVASLAIVALLSMIKGSAELL